MKTRIEWRIRNSNFKWQCKFHLNFKLVTGGSIFHFKNSIQMIRNLVEDYLEKLPEIDQYSEFRVTKVQNEFQSSNTFIR